MFPIGKIRSPFKQCPEKGIQNLHSLSAQHKAELKCTGQLWHAQFEGLKHNYENEVHCKLFLSYFCFLSLKFLSVSVNSACLGKHYHMYHTLSHPSLPQSNRHQGLDLWGLCNGKCADPELPTSYSYYCDSAGLAK